MDEVDEITELKLVDGTVYRITKRYIKSLHWDYFMYMPLYVSDDGDYVAFPLTARRELPADATLVDFKIAENG